MGVTIILTTHYIDEAEQMADRIGVINKGEIILVEDKAKLMQKLGTKQLSLELQAPLKAIPDALSPYNLTLNSDNTRLIYSYDSHKDENGIASLLQDLSALQIHFKDLKTAQSSLEDIFVKLVEEK